MSISTSLFIPSRTTGVILTGARFTQYWGDGEARSLGAKFVKEVVAFVDANNLTSLPKITERVVTDRNKGPCWWSITSVETLPELVSI